MHHFWRTRLSLRHKRFLAGVVGEINKPAKNLKPICLAGQIFLVNRPKPLKATHLRQREPHKTGGYLPR